MWKASVYTFDDNAALHGYEGQHETRDYAIAAIIAELKKVREKIKRTKGVTHIEATVDKM